MMRSAAFLVVVFAALAALGSSWLLAAPRPEASAAIAPAVPTRVAAPDVERPGSGTDPADDAAELQALHFLRERRTGLAQHELPRLAEVIVAEARRGGLDPALVLAVIQVESAGYNFAVSRVGALGLMQIMPATGRELARRAGLAWHGDGTLFDPVTNVRLGTRYLRQLADRYDGDLARALAAYNWGPGRIDRRLRGGGTLPTRYASAVREAHSETRQLAGTRSS